MAGINDEAIILDARDDTAQAYNSVKRRTRRMVKDNQNATSRIVANAAKMVGAIASIGIALRGIRAGIDIWTQYESALTDMTKVTDESLDSIHKKMQELPPILANNTEAVQAYYQTISAGVSDPKQAMETMKVAIMAANAAHVDSGEVIKGVTKIMAGFEGGVANAAEATDLLFRIEKEGQTSFRELIPVIGGLSKSSNDLAVSADEMGASLATITQVAGTTAEAATQYQAILTSLMKPTAEMTTAINDMGFADAQAAIQKLGFVDTIRQLKDSTGGSQVELGKLFSRVEAIKGVSALAANEFQTLDERVVSMGEAAGGTAKAFDDWSKTTAAHVREFKNRWTNDVINIVKDLAPALNVVMDVFAVLIKVVMTAFHGLQSVFLLIGGMITTLLSGFEELYNASIRLQNQLADTAWGEGMKKLGLERGRKRIGGTPVVWPLTGWAASVSITYNR